MSSRKSRNKEADVEDEIPTSTKTLALRAPKIHTSIQRLRQQPLNLNHAPENWLRSTPFEDLDGFNTNPESKFSSLR